MNRMMKRIQAKLQRRMSQPGQDGFTMIELIIVVLVIGILAAMALPQLGDVAGTASTNATAYQTSANQTYDRCAAQAANGGLDAAGVTALCGADPTP